jgi:elongation factor Ts
VGVPPPFFHTPCQINSETDFAARNEAFTSLVSATAAAALRSPAPAPAGSEVAGDALGALPPAPSTTAASAAAAAPPPPRPSLADAVAAVAGTVRENIVLRRGARLDAAPDGGVLGSYVHTAVGPGLGRMAALVALAPVPGAGPPPADATADLAGKLAMHVVATRPLALDRASVPAALVDAERAVLAAQAAASGKPPAVAAKMVEGRLGKWFEAAALLDQPYLLDDARTVGAVATGAGVTVTGFVRLQVGEGLDAKGGGGNFAAEVAETLRATTAGG